MHHQRVDLLGSTTCHWSLVLFRTDKVNALATNLKLGGLDKGMTHAVHPVHVDVVTAAVGQGTCAGPGAGVAGLECRQGDFQDQVCHQVTVTGDLGRDLAVKTRAVGEKKASLGCLNNKG